MVICSRMYLPLLKNKTDNIYKESINISLSEIINIQDIHGNTALHYAIFNYENIFKQKYFDTITDIIILLIHDGANIHIKNHENKSCYELLNDLLDGLLDVESFIIKIFDEVSADEKSTKDATKDGVNSNASYLEQLPKDISDLYMLYNLSYKEIKNLCGISKILNRRYCQDPNGKFWEILYHKDISESILHLDEENTILSGYKYYFKIYNTIVNDNETYTSYGIKTSLESLDQNHAYKLIYKYLIKYPEISEGLNLLTSIKLAIKFNNYDIADYLYNYSNYSRGYNMLDYAIQSGNIDYIQFLLTKETPKSINADLKSLISNNDVETFRYIFELYKDQFTEIDKTELLKHTIYGKEIPYEIIQIIIDSGIKDYDMLIELIRNNLDRGMTNNQDIFLDIFYKLQNPDYEKYNL